MKKLLKLALVALLVFGSSSVFAQKFGRIDSQELISLMPERDSVELKLNAFGKEMGEQLEGIQVEFNNKYQEFLKVQGTLSDNVKQVKTKELEDLQVRYEQLQEAAQRDIAKMQSDLMAPVIERAKEAIKKVAKSNNLVVVFDESAGALAYYDEAQLLNMLPLVKKELGIKDAPATTAPKK